MAFRDIAQTVPLSGTSVQPSMSLSASWPNARLPSQTIGFVWRWNLGSQRVGIGTLRVGVILGLAIYKPCLESLQMPTWGAQKISMIATCIRRTERESWKQPKTQWRTRSRTRRSTEFLG